MNFVMGLVVGINFFFGILVNLAIVGGVILVLKDFFLVNGFFCFFIEGWVC